MSRYFLILVCFVISLNLSAQVEHILAFPKPQRPFVIYDYFDSLDVDRSHRLEKMNELQAALEEKHDQSSAQLAWTLKQEDALRRLPDNKLSTELAYFENELDIIREKKWPLIENEILFLMGVRHFYARQFGHGMELMMHSYNASREMGWSSVFAKSSTLNVLADAYIKFGDYEKAIPFLMEVTQSTIPETSKGYPYKLYNSLGLCHQRMQQYDSAVHYYQLSHQQAELHRDSFWMTLSNGNMGNAYFLSGDMEKALPYIESDYHGSIRAGEIGSAVNASCLLANIELKRGNSHKADQYLQYAAAHIDTSYLETMVMYYENLFEYSKQSGDHQKALAYADLLSVYKSRKDEVFDKDIIDRAAMKVAVAEYDGQIHLLEAARSRQIMMRNALMIMLLLGGGVVFFWIKRMQAIREGQLQKLISAQNELSGFTKSLLEKNDLIQSFKAEIERLKSLGFNQELERSNTLGELINSNILTDDDWRRFRQLFDIVHPGFLVRLKEKFHDLTPAETRLLALVKLQLPAKDMADMLGINADSIYKTRYRLRKKINLPEEGNLEELVELV